jgi:hypothetical protein
MRFERFNKIPPFRGAECSLAMLFAEATTAAARFGRGCRPTPLSCSKHRRHLVTVIRASFLG